MKKLLSLVLGFFIGSTALAFASCNNTESSHVKLQYELSEDGTYYILVKGEGTNVVIPETYNDLLVTRIGNDAFSFCESLTSVEIPNSVTSIGYYAFADCHSLRSIKIPNSVTSIEDNAFNKCISLTSIELPSSVTSIECSPFSCCTSLTSITIDENNANYKDIDGNLYTKDGKVLIQYAIGKTDTSFVIPDSVTSIGAYAFEYCTSLISVEIGDSVTSIDSSAFYRCDSLTSITFSDTSTWYRTGNYDDWNNKTGGTQTDVTNASYNATYFKSTYYYYYWYKL